MNKEDGYVVVEAAYLLPLTSILILMLVYLCSYLYQGCFMMQAAYIAAFRGSRYPVKGEAYVQKQLDELLEREVLSFEEEERGVEENPVFIQVTLQKNTPFSLWGNGIQKLYVKQKSLLRNAVGYIRGIRKLGEVYDQSK